MNKNLSLRKQSHDESRIEHNKYTKDLLIGFDFGVLSLQDGLDLQAVAECDGPKSAQTSNNSDGINNLFTQWSLLTLFEGPLIVVMGQIVMRNRMTTAMPPVSTAS